ncbi:ABC transporter permease [Bifidobacterium sp. MA2]|uniref:ABC transporter permease n=1 Tax=Bifidobacterium santillanense TaxID=2809028 RepID=A0ABS5UQG9_9BIFI|nr:ABC transporter permease [Bifidobacterium santillanense]MBT1173120.1 ABC transporter permease [Bifidobacterium santillanense]
MFVLTNAWRAVTRRWATSALTVLVALLVSFGTIASLAILQENADAHGADYDAQTPNAVLRPTAKTAAAMKGDDAKSTTSKYLKFTDYNPYAIAAQEKSVSFTYSFTETLPVRQSDSIKAIPGSSDESADKTGGEFQLRSFYDAKAAKANDYGTYHLVDGKGLVFTSTKATGALISKSVADKNGLKVGDTFKVGDPTDSKKTYEFKVRGIYEYDDSASGSADSSSAKLAKENRENVIYTAYATAYTFGLDPDSPKANTWSVPDLNVIFDFTDVKTYNKFVKLAKKAKLPAGYEITSPSLDAYKASIEPLGSLAEKVRPALRVLAIGGVVVLLALTIARTWFGRDDEIGMAFVSGVTKGRLGWQFMVETFILTVVPAAIGLAAGGFGAKAIGAALAGGHATPVTSDITWTLIWDALGLVVALAIVAMLKAATFSYARLFAPVTYDGVESTAKNPTEVDA